MKFLTLNFLIILISISYQQTSSEFEKSSQESNEALNFNCRIVRNWEIKDEEYYEVTLAYNHTDV